MESLFEKHGGTYSLGADEMYYPNIVLGKGEEPRYGKYGLLRKSYLYNYK